MKDEPIGNPYPGLRTFEASESHLFFGREQQADELFKRLGRQRFVAVVGASGSGKSSLVRAGLLPLLEAGFLASAGRGWRVACLKPGNRPIERLAEALAALPGFAPDEQSPSTKQAWVEATLRRSSLGLIEAARLARMPEGEALLVVVDQFEELFRNRPEEGSVFVRLLIEAVHRPDGRIFVVLTMRSDYLGECALFRDLPETLNDAQYLVPRMTRQQLRRAIECPARVAGREVAPGLVNRLLNELGDDPNRLPVLQHALMCTWKACCPPDGEPGEVTVADYESVGGMKGALLRHANGTYERVVPTDRHREIAVVVFKALTGIDPKHQEVRRQTTVGELLAITGASREELTTVLEIFLAPGRTFLTRSPSDGPLDDSVEIDISHESLIRLWDNLAAWAKEEADSAQRYARLADRALLHERGEEDVLRNPQLDLALQWREKQRPNAAWAKRYMRDFDKTMAFIETSRRAHEEEIAREQEARRLAAIKELEERRRKRKAEVMQTVTLVSVLTVLILGVLIYTLYRGRRESIRQTAREQLRNALAAADRGDLLRSTHALAVASEGAVAEDKWLAAQSLWPYATAIPVDLALPSRPGATGAPVRILGVAHTRSENVAWPVTLVWTKDGKLLVWNPRTREFERDVAEHAAVTDALFSPDGSRAITWSDSDGRIRLWKVRAGLSLERSLIHEGLTGASFSSDGADVITWADNGVRVWSTQGRGDLTLPHDKSVACDRGGAAIPCAAIDPQRRIVISWSKRIPAEKASRPPAPVYGYGPGIVAGDLGDVGDVRVWDLSQQAPSARTLATEVNGARLSPRGTHVVTWTATTVSLWNARTTVEETVLPVRRPANGVVFDPSGRFVLAFADTTAWLVDTDRPGTPIVIGHAHPIKDATFLTDERLVTWDRDTVNVWRFRDSSSPGDVSADLIQSSLEHSGLSSIAISPDRKTLATWGGVGAVRLWDIERGQPIGEFPQNGPLRRIDFGPTNRTLLMIGQDGRMQLRNLASGVPAFDMALSRICTAPRTAVSAPSGGSSEPCVYMASLFDDYTMVAWAVPARMGSGAVEEPSVDVSQFVSIAPPTTGIARHLRELAPDARGRRAAVVSDEGLFGVLSAEASLTDPLWLESGTHEGYLKGMEISPDGRWAVAWLNPLPDAASPPALVWDLDTAAKRPLERHDKNGETGTKDENAENDDVAGAAFSPDARWLVTWSARHAWLWRLPDLALMHTIDGSHGLPPRPEPAPAIGGAMFGHDRSLIVWTTLGDIIIKPIADAPGAQGAAAKVERRNFGMKLSGAMLSADRRRIAGWAGSDLSGSGSVRVKVFALDDWRPAGRELEVKEGVTQVVVSSADGLLTLTGSGSAHLWSLSTGRRLADLSQDGPIRDVVGARNGLILTSSADGVARLWDGQSGLPVSRAMRHRGVILAAHFTPDEETVVTYGADGWRHVWDVTADRSFPDLDLLALVATGARMETDTPVALTRDEWIAEKTRLRAAIETHRDSRACDRTCPSAALLAALAPEPSSGPPRAALAANH